MKLLPRRSVLVVHSGFICTREEVSTYAPKLLPIGIEDQESVDDQISDNEIEYSKVGIPILKYPVYPGRCLDC